MFKKVILLTILFNNKCFHGYPIEEDERINLVIISRKEWGARPSTGTTELVTPAPLVILHHSSEPPACYTTEDCRLAMRQMQNFHQNTNHWNDIGYNFAVGSDGLAYEGRGWNAVGAHATSYNTRSIGIVLIGHWVSEIPPRKQLEAARKLIRRGVDLGHISPDYILLGHRQVGETECPGEALFEVLTTWGHFQMDAVGSRANKTVSSVQ